jgi:hypothetical protein
LSVAEFIDLAKQLALASVELLDACFIFIGEADERQVWFDGFGASGARTAREGFRR